MCFVFGLLAYINFKYGNIRLVIPVRVAVHLLRITPASLTIAIPFVGKKLSRLPFVTVHHKILEHAHVGNIVKIEL